MTEVFRWAFCLGEDNMKPSSSVLTSLLRNSVIRGRQDESLTFSSNLSFTDGPRVLSAWLTFPMLITNDIYSMGFFTLLSG